jgi:hypothetical protein
VIVRAIERPRSRPTLRRIAANRLDAARFWAGPRCLLTSWWLSILFTFL